MIKKHDPGIIGQQERTRQHHEEQPSKDRRWTHARVSRGCLKLGAVLPINLNRVAMDIEGRDFYEPETCRIT